MVELTWMDYIIKLVTVELIVKLQVLLSVQV
jgi:hypothetical protein